MATMLILTPEEADQVRGLTSKGNALAPTPLLDGMFALPLQCAEDPGHSKFRRFLRVLPKQEVAPEDFLASKRGDPLQGKPATATQAERDLLEACSYKSDWQEGVAVQVDAEMAAVDAEVLAKGGK